MKKTLAFVLVSIMVLAFASTAFAVIITDTPNGYRVEHDSAKNVFGYNNGLCQGVSSTNVYLISNPSQTKYHYTRVWFIREGHPSETYIGDSGRVYGYNTVYGSTDVLDNSSLLHVRSAWGGVY